MIPIPPGAVGPRTLVIPTHPGVQYHFCRSELPIYFLGHWDQFQYWRPQPWNVTNLFDTFAEAHLSFGPAEYARVLEGATMPGRTPFRFPGDFDVTWLMFNWQWKLVRGETTGKKLYRVAKPAELDRAEWEELLGRSDVRVVSFYPNTVAWLAETFGVRVPYVPLGLDPDAYGPWRGDTPHVLSIIHSWRERGWHYRAYREATAGLATLHVDHLDPSQPTRRYEELVELLRGARVYLHDGEQEYTITLVEAMMTGLPIVSFRLPGIERYVVQGENGFVCDDAAAVREACRALLADEALARRMGAESRRMALRDHAEARWRADWRRILSEWTGVPA